MQKTTSVTSRSRQGGGSLQHGGSPRNGLYGGASRSSLLVAAVAPLWLALSAAPALADDAAAAAAEERDEAAGAEALRAELEALRQSLAQQMLRLDEAEQVLARQSDLIDRQTSLIEQLESRLGDRVVASARADVLSTDEYRVQRGDNLYRIADKFGVSPQQIAEANDLRRPDLLQVGQILKMPVVNRPSQPLLARAADSQPGQTAPARAASAAGAGGATTQVAAATAQGGPQRTADASAQSGGQQAGQQGGSGLPEEVGQRPENERGPSIALLSDVGGILTPAGTMYLEPETSFTSTSDNRFFFQGTEILDALLIGAIEATDTDRRAVTNRLGLRYGLTSRIELNARVSHVFRDERVAGIAIGDGASEETTRDLNGSGFGDVEFGTSFQLTDGRRFPYTILNLRAKAPTGTGPFDLDRSPGGVEADLATGSGFWTVEPSLTFILPTPPASIFANIGYQMNLATAPDLQLGSRILQDFNPGDALTANIGVGLSVNDRFSLSFGYNQSFFRRSTSQFFNPTDSITSIERTPSANVGGFAFGGSYLIDDRTRVNVNTSVGATDEAPDMTISVRLQRRLFD
ncbi:MAG: LysM peptidoglycan-binding domain-containing protein [Alphaproteobacteria bacterium]|nr:LysM peptidoglycan-binding domain-containing protein [Alphaproteobacteria bacterium]